MKRIAIIAAAVALAGGAGFAITDSLGSPGDSSPSHSRGHDFRGGPHPGPPGGPHPDFAAALADELGLSEERVVDALEAVHEDLSPRRP